MKKLILCLVFCLSFIGYIAHANVPPPGQPGNIITNNGNGQYGVYCVGTGLSVTTSGAQQCLTSSGSGPVPSTAIIEENGTPILTETGQFIVEE